MKLQECFVNYKTSPNLHFWVNSSSKSKATKLAGFVFHLQPKIWNMSCFYYCLSIFVLLLLREMKCCTVGKDTPAVPTDRILSCVPIIRIQMSVSLNASSWRVKDVSCCQLYYNVTQMHLQINLWQLMNNSFLPRVLIYVFFTPTIHCPSSHMYFSQRVPPLHIK